eukprot:TRINITY_DN3300_c0_g1_i1.p1 TRINITY_DN3300_c0_g1~~TRINITY_DN3300_c0_g1_i1.p1  ORF type:complete len:726 (+),score=177.75 TRINITY_DN3300_c0_g1_i1:115-2292(+)
MNIFVGNPGIEVLDEEERENVFPFLLRDVHREERFNEEHARVLCFTDIYRCTVEKRDDQEESTEAEEEGVSSKKTAVETSVMPQDKQLRALEFVAKAVEHELEDPSMFDIDKYNCSCGKECAKKLPRKRFVRLVHSLRQMTSLELRKFVTYSLMPLMVYPTDNDILDLAADGKTPTKRRKRSSEVSKRRASVTYVLGRVKMCRTAFVKLVGITHGTLTRFVKDICLYDGAIPQLFDERHGSEKRMTEKRMSVVGFLRLYGEEFGYPCPSSHPSLRGSIRVEKEIILLPANTEKFRVYELYVEALFNPGRGVDEDACAVSEGEHGDDIILLDSDDDMEWNDGVEAVSFSHFLGIWKKECEWIRIAQGRSDLCDFCSRLEREKPDGWQVVVTAHKLLGKRERDFYKELICRSSVQDGSLHLTFDFAQCVRIPHEMHQAANLYFKSRYKIDIFGICAEAEGRTDVYCIPEGHCPEHSPKGSNYVIGMLDHYLSQEWLQGVRTLYLHADNCAGQNKNRFVLAYLAYLVACGRFDTITLAFMTVGHTQCGVDGTFGLIKQAFWDSERVELPEEFQDVVNKSCEPARAVNMEGYRWKNWKAFVDQFGPKVREIKKNHVFSFDKSKPLHVKSFRWSCDVATDEGIECKMFTNISDERALISPTEHGFVGIDDEKFQMDNLGLDDKRKEQLKAIIDMKCTSTAKEWWEETFQLTEAVTRQKALQAKERLGEKH